MSKKIQCKLCGSENHYKTFCYLARKQIKTTKPIKQKGKQYSNWAKFRTQWLKDNPQQSFICGICGNQVTRAEVILDHIKPRSSSPHLRYTASNIQPAHWICNSLKGSKH